MSIFGSSLRQLKNLNKVMSLRVFQTFQKHKVEKVIGMNNTFLQCNYQVFQCAA